MHMSYSLNTLKGGYIGDYIGHYYRSYQGDARSLDCSSHGLQGVQRNFETPRRGTAPE